MYQTLFIWLFLLPSVLFAEQNLAELKPLTGRGFIRSEKIQPGQLNDLQLEVQLQEGFLAYHDRFRLAADSIDGLEVGELFIDPIIEFDDSFSKKRKKGVKDKATITTQVLFPKQLPSGLTAIPFQLTYIACTKKFCLTPRTFEISVDIADKWPSKATVSSSAEIGSSDYIQRQIDSNLAYALLLIFFFGVLTSLTPCVYPLIPITLAVLGNRKDQSQLKSFLTSFVYVLGIGLTYAVLGVIAAQTGQLFGSLISHPIVVIAMSLIFFAMGLSLLGLFEIQAPAAIRNRMGNTQNPSGFGGVFVSGLLAGVIASPCVGPVLVGVLAYIAKSQNSALGFVLLFTFAMGFGSLFILLGSFSQLANRLPRSGAWMNTVKTILAVCLFGLSFYYAWPLVKKQFPESSVADSKTKIQWQAFSPKLVEEATAAGKPVIIDFYADWCAACVEMDQLTFSKTPIIEMAKNFVMLKVDATSPFKELTDWQQTYEVYGLPTMILIDSKGKVRKDLTLTGFEEAPLFKKRMGKALN